MSLRLRNIKKTYNGFEIDVDFSAETGELVTLLGPSGCGKTTTLRIIAGFIRPDSGEIIVDGRIINELPPHMRKIGIVFQDYALFPNMNVFDNIAFGPRMQGWGRRDTVERVRSLLELVHLTGYERRPATQLSGGEQQRVALARALAPNPRLLLLDEPLSALDARLRKGLRGEIREIQKELKVTTIYVTHDQEEALAISDKIVVMRDGRVEQTGSPREIYERPRTPFVANFVGVSNLISGRLLGIESGYAIVEGPLGRFKAPPPRRPRDGDEVMLVFRPEDCRLARSGGEANLISGRVTTCEYLGDSIQLEIQTQNGKLTVKLDSAADCSLGDRVGIAFDPEDCWILEGDRA
ncbi:MAG: ABC transporter ATP-binding protein [bacterium]